MVGASERAPWARIMYRNLRDYGYPGRLVLVNPRQKEVFGEAVRAVAARRAGAGRARDGHRARRRRRRRARRTPKPPASRPPRSIRPRWATAPTRNRTSAAPGCKDFLGRSKIKVAGPNCMGAYSYHETASSPIRTTSCAGSRRARWAPSSSRAARLQFWLRTAADRGLRFSYGITSGNEISFDLADYLNFLVDDPQHQGDRAVHRRHPPARRVHGGGGARARSRQADRRDQDRRHRKVASRRAVAHRRDRRRLRRLSRDVRALRHRTIAATSTT